MRALRETYAGRLLAAALIPIMTGCSLAGFGAGVGAAPAASSSASGSPLGPPPVSASASAADEGQSAFDDPVTNTGAFTQAIPFPVPGAIAGMSPELGIAYSSQGGLGVAGVGWDMPIPMIRLSTREGVRPGTLRDDLSRFSPRTWIDRYTGTDAPIAVRRESAAYHSAYTFTSNPNNDNVVRPIRDERGRRYHGGEIAAWEVTTPSGVVYRYGYRDAASTFARAGTASERKIAWMLDRVEDAHGNRMEYYYEEFPNDQTRYRQPILRAIEYGIPASAPLATERMVVLLEYVESPWKSFSFTTGTRIDSAFLLSDVCVLPRNHVRESTSAAGTPRYDVPGFALTNGSPEISEAPVMGCQHLTYDFQDPSRFGSSLTGRPTLREVQRIGSDGTREPPWEMRYRGTNMTFDQAYRDALADSTPERMTLPSGAHLSVSDRGSRQRLTDLNGDGRLDMLRGSASGDYDVEIDTGSGYVADSYENPLRRDASPMTLTSTEIDVGPDTTDSDCWYNFQIDVRWSASSSSGLGYSEPLTSAPPSYYVDDILDNSPLSLGASQYLDYTVNGPPPQISRGAGMAGAALTIDQLVRYGESSRSPGAFARSTSDCQDHRDWLSVDYCWDVGTGGRGVAGADLGCLDYAGSRWFTAGSHYTGYSSSLFDATDLNGDGLLDLVYAANVIQRTADGRSRDLARGANDWYWAPGTGDGFDTLRPWPMPSKDGEGLPGVDIVHSTGLLSTSTTTSDVQTPRAVGIGINASVTPMGFPVSSSVLFPGGSVGLPTSGRGLASAALGAIRQGLSSVDPHNAALMGGVASTLATQGRNAIPSVGVGLEITTAGLVPHLNLPFVGDVLRWANQKPNTDVNRQYQGPLDLNADGRPDYVSARFDAGSDRNAPTDWLLYRNQGTGFEPPVYFRFTDAPTYEDSTGLTRTVSSMSESTVFSDTKSDWFRDVGRIVTDVPYGTTEQRHGFVDLNGDGLQDFVDTHVRQESTSGGRENIWVVHFNQGDGFAAPVAWQVQGWNDPPSGCSHLLPGTAPHLSSNAFVQHDSLGWSFSRQTQSLLDVNQDGLLDLVAVEPAPIRGSGCGYVQGMRVRTDTELVERSSPYVLNAPIRVHLNTGRGFAAPVEWVGAGGVALSGSEVQYFPGREGSDDHGEVVLESRAHSLSWGVTSVADYNQDGVAEIAVRRSEIHDSGSSSSSEYDLLPIGFAQPDVLVGVTTPQGALAQVDYRYHVDPTGRMGQGQWVVESVELWDGVPAHLSSRVRTRYRYEGGLYSREHRAFWGFERVYTYRDGAEGYTVSRYYQERGFEGVLYCREVRRQPVASVMALSDELGALVGSHEAGWLSGAPRPTDYSAAAAVGNPATLHRPSGTPVVSADDGSVPEPLESSGGAVADATSVYGSPGGGGGEDAAIDEAEADDTAPPETAPIDYTEDASDATGLFSSADLPSDTDFGAPGDPSHGEEHGADTLPLYTPVPVAAVTQYGTIDLYPSADAVDPAALDCGNPSDSGQLVEREYWIYENLSGEPGVYTPRLTRTFSLLYDASGGNPRVTSERFQHDANGNEVRTVDEGDLAVTGDEVVTETDYTDPSGGGIRALPCHVRRTASRAGVGTVPLAEEWIGYDGAPADGSCPPALTGDPTETRVEVEPGRSVTTARLFTPEGLLESETSPSGHTRSRSYDPLFPWLVVEESADVTNPAGLTTLTRSHRYHGVHDTERRKFGLPHEQVAVDGATTTWTYDGLGRLASERSPGGFLASLTEYVYRDFDASTGQRLPQRERETSFGGAWFGTSFERLERYDGFGRVLEVQAVAPPNDASCGAGCFVVAAESTYDADGRVTSARAPYFSNEPTDVRRTETTYDLLGRQTSVVGPNGATTEVAYDREQATTVGPDGEVSVERVDARGHLLERFDYLGSGATLYRETRYERRPDGQVLRIEDDAGDVWEREYDLLGREVRRTDPDGGESVRLYDDDGLLRLSLDARFATTGVGIEMQYDELGRPVRQRELEGATRSGLSLSGGMVTAETRWSYDVDPSTLGGTACTGSSVGHLSRVERLQSVSGALTTVSLRDFCYDSRGHRTVEEHTIDGRPFRFSWTYDLRGNPTRVTYPDGHSVALSYDAGGHLVSGAEGSDVFLSDVAYDAEGTPTRRELSDGRISESTCFAVTATGRRARRIGAGPAGYEIECGASESGDVVSGTATHELRYGFSAGARVTSREESFTIPLSLASVTETRSYVYDDLGRLTEETPGASAPTAFTYDTRDNLLSIGAQLQGYGDPARSVRNAGPHALVQTTGGDSFHYDPAGSVERWETTTGADYGFARSATGRIVAVRDHGALVQENLYDAEGVRVLRRDASGDTLFVGHGYRVNPDGTTETAEASGGYRLDRSATGGAIERYYTRPDLVASNGAVMDAHGRLVQHVSYSAWGQTLADDRFDPDPTDGVTPDATDELFNGHVREGLYGAADAYDFGARVYVASTGRWLSLDALEVDGLNRYAFVRSDPGNLTDPDGNAGCPNQTTATASGGGVTGTLSGGTCSNQQRTTTIPGGGTVEGEALRGDASSNATYRAPAVNASSTIAVDGRVGTWRGLAAWRGPSSRFWGFEARANGRISVLDVSATEHHAVGVGHPLLLSRAFGYQGSNRLAGSFAAFDLEGALTSRIDSGWITSGVRLGGGGNAGTLSGGSPSFELTLFGVRFYGGSNVSIGAGAEGRAYSFGSVGVDGVGLSTGVAAMWALGLGVDVQLGLDWSGAHQTAPAMGL